MSLRQSYDHLLTQQAKTLAYKLRFDVWKKDLTFFEPDRLFRVMARSYLRFERRQLNEYREHGHV